MEGFSLETYLSNSTERIVKDILKASMKSPKASMFMLQYMADSRRARQRRADAEAAGAHIPPFLIASISTQCNLHCKGCYARATENCLDGAPEAGLLTADQWDGIFQQAEQLGIAFILLAGGEPLVRPDVLQAAGRRKKCLFPVITNGTLISGAALERFDRDRNLLPILSIEGTEATTDSRRGPGVYRKLLAAMEALQHRGILFGASVTVTKQNLDEVLSDQFLQDLTGRGLKGILYIEYVPTTEADQALAPDDAVRATLDARLAALRAQTPDVVFLSFPGDEKAYGGCLAAGRGFFHINAYGGAEPCPFSPFSDTSLAETPLRDALRSPLFLALQRRGNLAENHVGGCVLYTQREEVARLLQAGLT